MTEEKTEHLKLKLQLTQPYILAVGTQEPRKNLNRLIKAWQPLAKEYQLIIAGARGWDQLELPSTDIARQQLKFLGFVSDQELAVLMAEADLFAYPSLYEGFGLPILEAFHHGTPVVTSDISSLPEVAGNAAVLVDPTSVESIRAGLKKILSENTQEQRQRLQKMIVRQHLFSWQNTAQQTIKVYQQAIQSQT